MFLVFLHVPRLGLRPLNHARDFAVLCYAFGVITRCMACFVNGQRISTVLEQKVDGLQAVFLGGVHECCDSANCAHVHQIAYRLHHAVFGYFYFMFFLKPVMQKLDCELYGY